MDKSFKKILILWSIVCEDIRVKDVIERWY